MEQIECVKCKKDMPKKRFELFGYSHCINCSVETPRRGVSFSLGVGEDTWTETIIMSDEQYKKYQNTEKALVKLNK